MKILFGQGNPGQEYKQTRHNVGTMALDMLAEKHSSSFTKKTKFFAEVAEIHINSEKILIVKPTTFYNETGHAASILMHFYNLSPKTDLLVLHDDLAIPFGTLRIREKGSDAGNNGIKSLNAHLGPDYFRLRIGIYNELRDRQPDADFVLGKFTKDETESLRKLIIPATLEIVDDFCHNQLQLTSRTLLQP